MCKKITKAHKIGSHEKWKIINNYLEEKNVKTLKQFIG